jgi:hypothetical protein
MRILILNSRMHTNFYIPGVWLPPLGIKASWGRPLKHIYIYIYNYHLGGRSYIVTIPLFEGLDFIVLQALGVRPVSQL